MRIEGVFYLLDLARVEVIDPARLFLNGDCGAGYFPALVKTRMCRVNNGII
jgi:hypothetical protein